MKRLAARLLHVGLACLVLWLALSRLEYPWNWSVVYEYRALFIAGFQNTMLVSLGAIALGLVIGVTGGVARVSENPFISEAAALYVEIFRGTPLLAQIYIFYFCLAAAIGYDNPFVIGMVCLAFFSGAYVTEMVRAGIESIDQGQWEAAESSGLTRGQVLRHVVFPQAFRRVIPPIAGQFVSLIKDSSLLSVIAVRELTKSAEVINATTFRTFEAYLPLALFYLFLTYPLTSLTYMLEKRIDRSRND